MAVKEVRRVSVGGGLRHTRGREACPMDDLATWAADAIRAGEVALGHATPDYALGIALNGIWRRNH